MFQHLKTSATTKTHESFSSLRTKEEDMALVGVSVLEDLLLRPPGLSSVGVIVAVGGVPDPIPLESLKSEDIPPPLPPLESTEERGDVSVGTVGAGATVLEPLVPPPR